MKLRSLFGLTLAISLAALTFFSSCKKDEPVDPRDQYVGTWHNEQTGSITLYYAGQIIGTAPIDASGTSDISKSGDNDLMIDGKLFTLNGSNLTSNPESIAETQNGFNMVGTATYSGHISSGLIIVDNDMTGSWSSSDGSTGTFSGTVVLTFTKQ